MGIERQHNRGDALAVASSRQVLGNFLMAAVHSVKVPNRHVSATIEFWPLKTSQQGHRVISGGKAVGYFQFSSGVENRLSLSRSISIPSPGASGIDNSPAPSKQGTVTAKSSMYAQGVRYSTYCALGSAAVNCRSAARPTTVFQPCGTNRILWS